MDERQEIAERLHSVHEGPAWHGPALREILQGVTAQQAARRPPAAGHSIWELVAHIAAWEDVVRRRLAGERIASLSPEQDFPAVPPPSEAAWQEQLAALAAASAALQQAVLAFPAARLGETVAGKTYTFRRMLMGAVEHAVYHAGQIALLKKAFRA